MKHVIISVVLITTVLSKGYSQSPLIVPLPGYESSAPPNELLGYQLISLFSDGCKYKWSKFVNTNYKSSAIYNLSSTLPVKFDNVQGNGSFEVVVSDCVNSSGNGTFSFSTPIRYLGPAGSISMNSSSNSLLSCGTQTVTFTTTTVTNATNYNWNVSGLSGWNIVSGQGTSSITVSSSSSTGGTISCVATRADAAQVSSESSFVVTRPTIANGLDVSGDNFVCSNQTKTYSLTGTPTAGSTFVWSATGLTIVGSNTNATVNTTLNGSGTGSIQVAISNTCGTDTRSKSMQLGQYSQSQMAISGPSTVCFNSNNNYFYAPFYSGATYQWTLSPSSSSSFASTNAFNLSSAAGSSNTLSVKISNDCGTLLYPPSKLLQE